MKKYASEITRLSKELRIPRNQAVKLYREAQQEQPHCPYNFTVYLLTVEMHEIENDCNNS